MMQAVFKRSDAKFKLASVLSALLYGVLILCANTNSSLLIHEPVQPRNIAKFKRI